MSLELAVVNPGEQMSLAKNVAGLCEAIVRKTALKIAGKKHVRVEGWQSIASAFGCTASARDVQKVFDEKTDDFIGFKAIGEVRRQADGVVIATGEGFVGVDEPRWFGGTAKVWDSDKRKQVEKHYDAAPEYAARAMAQTRAVSRACRAAFSFVVVMIDEGLSTTPAEEIEPGDEPHGAERTSTPAQEKKKTEPQAEASGNGKDWRNFMCSYGTKDGPMRGKQLGELTDVMLGNIYRKFVEALNDSQVAELSAADKKMREGLILWHEATQQG